MAQQHQQPPTQYSINPPLYLPPPLPPPQYPPPPAPHHLPFPPHNPYPYNYQYSHQPYQHHTFIPHYSYPSSHPLPPQHQLLQHPRPTTTTSSKRARETSEYDGGEVVAAAAKRKKGVDVLFRVVVNRKQIGKVIGKQGCRIQKVRDETKANIKIADALAPYEERVIIVSSKSNENGITDAEKALHQVAELVLMDDGKSLGALCVTGSGVDVASSIGLIDAVTGAQLVTNAIRLLIAGSQADCLIQTVEMLRNSSCALVTVLAPNQLPYCASAHESDRLVQISGEVPAILKAVDEIGCLLRLNPAKQVISISPAYNLTTTRAVPHYIDPSAAEYVTLDMVISETMVGGLIGKSGSNISKIRIESGATIKVVGGKGEQKHRQIQLGGTAEQVALARQRVDEYIYSQLVQQADGQ